MKSLELTREQILAYRRTVQSIDERLGPGPDSLHRAAWAGVQDSMPRAAILSIHARVSDTPPDILGDPSLVQVWGPRYAAYVVATEDVAPFTLGRLPDEGPRRRRAEEIAARLAAFLEDREMGDGPAGRSLGVHPNALRYASPTGTVLIRWDGARQTTVRTVRRPPVDPVEARFELARRYLHAFGPMTPNAFAEWAGVQRAEATAAFHGLSEELVPVRTPIGDAWILAQGEPAFRADAQPPAAARLLPSGDTYWLLQGADRELLVPDAEQRRMLWTPRVWPGALLVAGEIVGTWRRANEKVTIQSWRRLSPDERAAVEAEADALPLPGLRAPIAVSWHD